MFSEIFHRDGRRSERMARSVWYSIAPSPISKLFNMTRFSFATLLHHSHSCGQILLYFPQAFRSSITIVFASSHQEKKKKKKRHNPFFALGCVRPDVETVERFYPNRFFSGLRRMKVELIGQTSIYDFDEEDHIRRNRHLPKTFSICFRQ